MPGTDPPSGPDPDAARTSTDLDERLAELHAESPAAAQLLGLLACLADAPVPAWLLAGRGEALPSPLADRARSGADPVLRTADALGRRGLARVEDGTVRLSADASDAVRERMSGRERGQFGAAAVRLLFEAFPDRVGQPEDRGRCRTLAPHVRAAARHAGGGGRATAEAVHALARLGAFHRSEDELEAAEDAYRRALDLAERGTPVEGPLRAVLADELASVLAASGREGEAREKAERAVALAEETLSPDAPQLPLLLDNAATTFREAGVVDRAVECRRHALEAARGARSGATRPLEVELLAGLADLEMARERWTAAAEAAREGLDAAVAEWGERHPQTARLLWMLGDARLGLGDPEEAAGCFRRSLAVEEALHGEAHPAVGQKAIALGLHLEEGGRTEEARAAYRRAVAALEASLGPDSDPARTARGHLDALDDAG